MGAWKNASAAAPVRGVVGRATAAAGYRLDRWAPSDDAGRFVEHFWSVRWDLRGQDPLDTTVITFPSMHLTREWGADAVRHGFPLPCSLVHGVVPRVFDISIKERGAVVGARLKPGGFTARFGRDASAYTGKVLAMDTELFGSAMLFEDDVDSAAAQLDAAIGACRDDPDPTYREVTRLLDRIRDDDGVCRVEQVLQCSPWSARTTQRVFRRYVGVPVKWVLCRYRLQQAALEIESAAEVDFAELAVRLGWYDQAHFINDFRSMLGTTPGDYAAKHGS